MYCFQLSYDNKCLCQNSEELDRRTKETQKLQEEVENATKVALERFGCTYGNRSPEQSCHNCKFNVSEFRHCNKIFPMCNKRLKDELCKDLFFT